MEESPRAVTRAVTRAVFLVTEPRCLLFDTRLPGHVTVKLTHEDSKRGISSVKYIPNTREVVVDIIYTEHYGTCYLSSLSQMRCISDTRHSPLVVVVVYISPA